LTPNVAPSDVSASDDGPAAPAYLEVFVDDKTKVLMEYKPSPEQIEVNIFVI
jgi:hypothetical protein